MDEMLENAKDILNGNLEGYEFVMHPDRFKVLAAEVTPYLVLTTRLETTPKNSFKGVPIRLDELVLPQSFFLMRTARKTSRKM